MHSERTLELYDELASIIQDGMRAVLVEVHRQLVRREPLDLESVRSEAARIVALCSALDAQVAVDPGADLG